MVGTYHEEIPMGSIEDLAGVFFDAGQGIINTFLTAAQGFLNVVKGSIGA